MKPSLRIYVSLSLLVVLAGCATQGKPPPTITLDEPVAAQPLPELPKPIEVVAVPQPLPLPEQLKLLLLSFQMLPGITCTSMRQPL